MTCAVAPTKSSQKNNIFRDCSTDSEEEAFKFNFGGSKVDQQTESKFVLSRRLKYSFCVNLCLSVAEISRLRADKALGEFIGRPEEAPAFWTSQGKTFGRNDRKEKTAARRVG
jgi:hypothetical protein